MRVDSRIKELEEKKQEIISFTNELDEKLRIREINLIEYQVLMSEKYPGKTKEELMKEIHEEISKLNNESYKHNNARVKLGIAGAILVLIALISIFSHYTTNTPTGFAIGTKQITQTINYNKTFYQYTETKLELSNLISLKISGTLEGTGAKVKLRINGTDYLVVEITNPSQQPNIITGLVTEEIQPEHIISTDKTNYALGETITITITPEAENKSLYVNYGEETHKLEGNTYTPEVIGEYTAIALIVLPNDILRLENNFTVTEQPNETLPETPAEPTPEPALPTGYEFANLCTETCNIPETNNPTLIIELTENTTLNINTITITQNKENSAPEQTHNIPDIDLITGQTTTLDLNQYFSDTDGDTIQYDINEIPEINAQITQNTLTINSQQTGTYTAFIYATDGDKLTTSNTFQITITEETINKTTNETTPITNETTNQTNITLPETTGLCSNPNINLRPSICFVGIENQAFEELNWEVQNKKRARVGIFTRFGNLIIKGIIIQNVTGEPGEQDFTIGFSERNGFSETITNTAWISTESGNLYLRGRIYENQEVLSPAQYNTFVIRNKFGLILGYFDELTGDLYLRGNIVQLGKV